MHINKDIRTNFHKALQKHTIPIIDRTDESNLENGSGVFCEFMGNYFILTAKHVIENINDDDLLICLGLWEQRYALKKEHIWTHGYLDLAFIRLNKTEATLGRGLNIEPIKIGEPKIQDLIDKKFRHAVCGFPSEMAKLRTYEKQVDIDYYLLTTRMLPFQEWPKNLGSADINRIKNPQEDFMLLLDDGEATNIVGEKRKIGKIHGMSGGGVWLYNPLTENDDKPEYSLYGIQSSLYKKAYQGYSLMSGSVVEPLIKQIKYDYSKK